MNVTVTKLQHVIHSFIQELNKASLQEIYSEAPPASE